MTAKGLVLNRTHDISLTRRMRRILVARSRWHVLGFAIVFRVSTKLLAKAG
jgi:hypothetical protein